jgi:hypothetical protein
MPSRPRQHAGRRHGHDRRVEATRHGQYQSTDEVNMSSTDTSTVMRGACGSGPGPAAYASFSDPDGNGWLLQEITTRLPGREWED